jgi:outer membrane protein OmpA-like peptidoglycan-associated protein
MRSFRILSLTLGAALCAAPALAQMYPGQGITVNPRAAGSQVLLYPGGQYVRLVPPLMQPGTPPTGLEPIYLHMPVPHRVARIHHTSHVAALPDTTMPIDQSAPPVATDTAPSVDATPTPAPTHHRKHKTEIAAAAPPPDTSADTAPAATDTVPSVDTAPTPAPTHHSKHQTAAAAPDTSSDTSIPFSFGGPPATPPKPEPKTTPTPKSAPVKVASTEPPPVQTPDDHSAKGADAGLSKRGEILFKHAATDPAPAQFDGLKLLAGDLTSALQAGATRVQLQAYGGSPGDKGSDARRLSLKRALAIRQVLIDDGVPSTKIDVRAMGGIDDKGNTDRVDVFVRAG